MKQMSKTDKRMAEMVKTWWVNGMPSDSVEFKAWLRSLVNAVLEDCAAECDRKVNLQVTPGRSMALDELKESFMGEVLRWPVSAND